jgi:DMSO/TMAO reductase YedYZ heme-binding membrane subunit
MKNAVNKAIIASPATVVLSLVFMLTSGITVFAQDQPATNESDFRFDRINALVAIVVFASAVLLFTRWAKQGKKMYIRKMAGLDAIEEAVGRATEMGKPVLFIPGLQEIDEIETIAGVSILGRVAKITAQYETPLIVPVRYPLVLAAGQDVVEQAYREAGKPDAYNKDTVRYVAGDQMAFASTVNGMLMRDRPAANIYMGAFFAESLVIAETGNAAGSIQIAGTAQPEQLPFFIAACDYTLMGEELYAASAYLSHESLLLGGLKGQDFFKLILVAIVIIGLILMMFGAADTYLSWFKIS